MDRQTTGMWISLMAAGFLLAVPGAMAQTPAGEMNATEAAVIQELNLARTDPVAYAGFVEEHKRSFKSYNAVLVDGRWYKTSEGVPAVDEAIAYLKKVAPAPALSPAPLLALAARDHVRDIGPRGLIGHEGTDGTKADDRIRRHGKPRAATGEIIAFGPATARAIVIQLIVDDGVADRGHRRTIFDPDFRVAGVAIGLHKALKTMCVVDFADQIY